MYGGGRSARLARRHNYLDPHIDLRPGEDDMDLIRTELIVGTLIAEKRRQAQQEALIDASAPMSLAAMLAGRLGRLLMRVGSRLESIECDRLRVPAPYFMGVRATD